MKMSEDSCISDEKANYGKILKESEERDRKWFLERGFGEVDMMYADAAFKNYLQAEESKQDKRFFDNAPGFRRMFMMGYFTAYRLENFQGVLK